MSAVQVRVDRGLRIEGLVVGRGASGRRIYDAAAKAKVVALCGRPGVSVARVALENGVNASLLRKWMQPTRRRVSAKPQMLPVVVAPDVEERTVLARTFERTDAGTLSVEFVDARVVITGTVDSQMLSAAIRALRER